MRVLPKSGRSLHCTFSTGTQGEEIPVSNNYLLSRQINASKSRAEAESSGASYDNHWYFLIFPFEFSGLGNFKISCIKTFPSYNSSWFTNIHGYIHHWDSSFDFFPNVACYLNIQEENLCFQSKAPTFRFFNKPPSSMTTVNI